MTMPSQMVNLPVNASIPIDRDFWSDDDGRKALCKSLSVTVHGNSFEDANGGTWSRTSKGFKLRGQNS